ncbi:MAG TPA: HAD family hydrolase [Candidatus Limnocylindrales bacterium]|nr:HAD family hydrolase [Candidatus Limnocylindrales bacterium]
MSLHPALTEIDLVVFDKDGTLISFEAMWGGWARRLGARLEDSTHRPVAGDVYAAIGFDPVGGRVLPGGPLAIDTMAGIEERIGAVLRRWCPSISAARRALAEAWFEPDPVELAVPLTDLGELFDALLASGKAIAIATTDDRGPTEATLQALGVAPAVTTLLCGDDDGPVKPSPEAFAAVCERAGHPAERCAMVGDTPADLRMARHAGAGLVVGVLSGVGSPTDLAPDADLVVASVGELLLR